MTSGMPGMKRELALLLALATLWGGSYTFIKIGVQTTPPVTLIAARTLIAGAILLGIIWWRGLRLPIDFVVWRQFLFQACLNSVIPFNLIAWAERTIDAGLATILNSTSPIFAFLLTALVVRHESVSARKLFGVVAGIAGTGLVVGAQALSGARAMGAGCRGGGDDLLRRRRYFWPGVQRPRPHVAGGRLACLRRGSSHAV